MNTIRILILGIFLSFLTTGLCAQLILNEFSQGNGGVREYIELLVIGTKTCKDSTADIRNWMFDDQCGWYGGSGSGIAAGHCRFANISQWANVPYGSIILIYNNADKNGRITLPDDESDANKDYVYIVPVSSKTLESTLATPTSPSSINFVYPNVSYSTTNTWGPLGLANSGDAVIIINPANRTNAYFSLVFGLNPAANYKVPTILKGTVGANSNCYLNDGNYLNASSWIIGDSPANETPGAANSSQNQAWINSMRQSPVNNNVRNITNCIKEGETYFFYGNTLSVGGNYTAKASSPDGCDTIINLYLTVTQSKNTSFQNCGSLTYNGIIYYNSTTVKDTVKSFVTGCDSLINTANIIINSPVSSSITACIKEGGTYTLNGKTLTATGYYTEALKTTQNCDSTVNLYLTVAKTENNTLTGCGTITYNGNTYSTSTIVKDTIKSIISNCDSLYKIVTLTIQPGPKTSLNICLKEGESYLFNGININTSGYYNAIIKTAENCDSTVDLLLTVPTSKDTIINGCGKVIYNGKTYLTSTIVKDTLTSLVSGCDSIYKNVTIDLLSGIHTNINACIKRGESFLFDGKSLSANGYYTQVLKTAENCDSSVHLYLTVSDTINKTVTGCGAVSFNGQSYTANTVVSDTLRSTVSGCDSIITFNKIIVLQPAKSNLSKCIKAGDGYLFNGVTLKESGIYTQTISIPQSCDSTITLYLTVAKNNSINIQNCGSVVYNGITYKSSTVIADTIKSLNTGCDSMYNQVNITITNKPTISISGVRNICKGETVSLAASASGTTIIQWLGYPLGGNITVSPTSSTNYTVVATDSNSNCSDTTEVNIAVEDFILSINANPNPATMGAPVIISTSSSIPYIISTWQPTSLFTNQNVISQNIVADTSITIYAVAKTVIGCTDTAAIRLNVDQVTNDLYVPNAFSPNGDGKNDFLQVYGTGINSLQLKIFNQWGEMIYETADKKGWNGMYKSKPQPVGVYMYVLKVTLSDNKTFYKKGSINLIR